MLIPKGPRRELMEKALETAGCGDFQIPEYLLHASLCHRCRQVADALTRTHKGDLRKVLAHVQVEPWAMSRRYSRGLVQVGPERAIDAAQRQVTADRSLSALPIELQNMTLFESFGPLVDASGGILEFEDMLKRPVDAYKYLLGTIETGEAALGQSILKMNSVLMATSNDVMLEAFHEHHEYPSFRDRLTLISLPYITRRSDESQIYEMRVVPNVTRHVAPHAVEAAAHWSVLTRLHKPDPNSYAEPYKPLIDKLDAAQKCELYDDGTVPEGLTDEQAALLIDALGDIRGEDSSTWGYEGRYGASPRLIHQLLMTASLSDQFDCLSPFAVIDELEDLCERVREYPFLEREVTPGGYNDHEGFVRFVEEGVLERVESEVRAASGLVEEHKHVELLDKYVLHVRHKVKGEKVANVTTDQQEEPDESMMRGVEESLGVSASEKDEYRKGVISRIAGWAIEHPGEKMTAAAVLPGQLRRLKEAYFERHREKVALMAGDALRVLDENVTGMDSKQQKAGEKLVEDLIADYGYCENCVKDGISRLLAKRFAR